MTPAQRRVLTWLVAYPGVGVTAAPGSRAYWTHWWRDDKARAHMMSTMETLEADSSIAAPRIEPIAGMTPRITNATFRVLFRSGWLRRQRIGHVGSYTISAEGILALKSWSTP